MCYRARVQRKRLIIFLNYLPGESSRHVSPVAHSSRKDVGGLLELMTKWLLTQRS